MIFEGEEWCDEQPTHLQVVATGESRLAQTIYYEDHPGIGILDFEDVVLLDCTHPETKREVRLD